ncbi:MAG: hypothetical protein FJZ59_00285 [Chlamydiae bacterium]|nr:hypothetical protein [Chlamydiota bacterium]
MEPASLSRRESPVMPLLDLGAFDAEPPLEKLCDGSVGIGSLSKETLLSEHESDCERGVPSLLSAVGKVEVVSLNGNLAERRVDLVRSSILGMPLKFEGRELPSFKSVAKPLGRPREEEVLLEDEIEQLAGAMNCADTSEYLEEGTPYPKVPHPKYRQEKRGDGLFYYVLRGEEEPRGAKRRK